MAKGKTGGKTNNGCCGKWQHGKTTHTVGPILDAYLWWELEYLIFFIWISAIPIPRTPEHNENSTVFSQKNKAGKTWQFPPFWDSASRWLRKSTDLQLWCAKNPLPRKPPLKNVSLEWEKNRLHWFFHSLFISEKKQQHFTTFSQTNPPLFNSFFKGFRNRILRPKIHRVAAAVHHVENHLPLHLDLRLGFLVEDKVGKPTKSPPPKGNPAWMSQELSKWLVNGL